MAVDLAVQMGRLRLKNPIATASGTFGYGLEFAHLAALDRQMRLAVVETRLLALNTPAATLRLPR